MSTLHQNKLGMVIDYKSAQGKKVFLDLVAVSDVVIDNFAPGIMDKMGLGYSVLREKNPKLIYGAISGFGLTGPLSDRTAFDIISQATGGIMYANHSEGRPPGVFFGDLVSGAYCALGVLAALLQRGKTGEGQLIDVSMQDVMYFQNFWGFSERANEAVKEKMENILGVPISRLLTDEDRPMPFWNSYKVADGHVAVVALTDKQWECLMQVIGREDLITDPRFSSFVGRIQNSADGIEAVEGWFTSRTTAQVVEALSAKRIPCGAVQDYEDLAGDPQLAHRRMSVAIQHATQGEIHVPALPIQMSCCDLPVESPAPDLGEHTEKVLREVLKYDDKAIAALKSSGAVM